MLELMQDVFETKQKNDWGLWKQIKKVHLMSYYKIESKSYFFYV